MLVRKIVVVGLVLGLLGIAQGARAQTDESQQSQQESKTILERLDNLGKTIFSGFLPSEKSKPNPIPKPSAKSTVKSHEHDRVKTTAPEPSEQPEPSVVSDGIGRRKGSVLGGSGQRASELLGSVTADDDFMPENTPAPRGSVRSAKQAPSAVVERSVGIALPNDDRQDVEPTASQDTMVRAGKTKAEAPQTSVGQQELPVVQKSFPRPLYKRMAAFRQSAFNLSETKEPAAEPYPDPVAVAESEPEPARTASTVTQPETPEPKAPKSVATTPEAPMVAQRPAPAAHAERAEPVGLAEPPEPAEPTEPAEDALSEDNEQASEQVSEQVSEAPSHPLAAVEPTEDEDMLITRKGPVLSVRTYGPRQIMVGKEATYEVKMVNLGAVAAEDLIVYVSLPEWTEVVSADAGSTKDRIMSPSIGVLQWHLGRLEARQYERLILNIVPHQSQPFDLAVRWEDRAVVSQASIEVQEPKLALQLEGPREILYGKKETYRLRLMNTGSGAAENAVIMLMPIGGGENVPATHKIRTLAAGEEKVLDVELTARQVGNLTIQLDARADGGVHAELSESVLVRRAELNVEVTGPKAQFVGATTDYAVRVANPGTAPARNVNVVIALPEGAQCIAGHENALFDANENKLYWTIDTIGPGVDQMFMVRCRMGSAGVSRIGVKATADDQLVSSADAITRVEAVADLTMDVRDPQGPVAVGSEAVYKVCVRNRGTKEARDVEVFAYFSNGIEPTGAEGAQSRLGPGQIAFQPIPVLGPGKEVVLIVHARAEEPGNHIFRAEAHCKTLGFRLVSEATNLYYSETSIADKPAGEAEAVRTGSRPPQDR